MTAIAIALGQTGFLGRGITQSISGEAEKLEKMELEAIDELRKNIVNESFVDVQESLKEIREECSVENWDGYDAEPVKMGAYMQANRFIDNLPFSSFDMPEASITPDGDIILEWSKSRMIFSIIIESNGTLTYAGVFGGNTTHGTEDFGDAIPKTILENIERVFS